MRNVHALLSWPLMSVDRVSLVAPAMIAGLGYVNHACGLDLLMSSLTSLLAFLPTTRELVLSWKSDVHLILRPSSFPIDIPLRHTRYHWPRTRAGHRSAYL